VAAGGVAAADCPPDGQAWPPDGLRSQTIEPVFGQLKTVQGAQRFMRRGLGACEAEWKLLCGTHNLLKLWRYTRRQAVTAPLAAWAAKTTLTCRAEVLPGCPTAPATP
jgi:hypothetical protein